MHLVTIVSSLSKRKTEMYTHSFFIMYICNMEFKLLYLKKPWDFFFLYNCPLECCHRKFQVLCFLCLLYNYVFGVSPLTNGHFKVSFMMTSWNYSVYMLPTDAYQKVPAFAFSTRVSCIPYVQKGRFARRFDFLWLWPKPHLVTQSLPTPSQIRKLSLLMSHLIMESQMSISRWKYFHVNYEGWER